MPDRFLRLEELPGVASEVAEARAAVDKLLTHRLLRRRSAELSAESILRGARASASLEGYDVPLEALRADASDVPGAVTGALNVSAALGELLGTWEKVPRQVLARLHVLAAGPEAGEAVGRPRSFGDEVADPLGLGAAPSPPEVAARLEGLLTALAAPTKASALVVAGVVHAELLALRAFGSADGVVARAAARLVLVGRGLDPKAVTQPEVGHLEEGGYAAAAAAYVAGDPAAFLVHECRAVALGAREGLAVAESLLRAD